MDSDEFRRVINKLRMKHDKTIVDFGKNLGCPPPGSGFFFNDADLQIFRPRQAGKTSAIELLKDHQRMVEEALTELDRYLVEPDIVIEFSL